MLHMTLPKLLVLVCGSCLATITPRPPQGIDPVMQTDAAQVAAYLRTQNGCVSFSNIPDRRSRTEACLLTQDGDILDIRVVPQEEDSGVACEPWFQYAIQDGILTPSFRCTSIKLHEKGERTPLALREAGFKEVLTEIIRSTRISVSLPIE